MPRPITLVILNFSSRDSIKVIREFDLPLPRMKDNLSLIFSGETLKMLITGGAINLGMPVEEIDANKLKYDDTEAVDFVVCGVNHDFERGIVELLVRSIVEYSIMLNRNENPFESYDPVFDPRTLNN